MSGSGQVNVGGAVNSIETALAVPAGKISGYSSAFRFGINDSVGTTAEDLWEVGGVEVYLASAETMSIVSDDANDTSGGTGAQSVIIFGLDDNYLVISETIIMNGLVPVVTLNSYLRVNDFFVDDSGTSDSNVGTILCTASVAATPHAIIGPAQGRLLKTQYTIPADKYGFFTTWTVSGLSGDQATFTFQFRGFEKSWQVGHVVQSFESSQSIETNPFPRFTPKTDLRVQAFAATGSAIELTSTYQLYLIDESLIS